MNTSGISLDALLLEAKNVPYFELNFRLELQPIYFENKFHFRN
jgi:hypothetical protein